MLVFWKPSNKAFYMSQNLIKNLDRFIDGVLNKKTSAVFLIDGKSGLGKSTLSTQVGCYINNKVKEWYKKKGISNEAPDFTLDDVTWTPQTFLEKFNDIKKGGIVIMDESMIIGNRSSMSEVNRTVIIMMSMIRSKQVFVIFNVNSIFDLDKNLPLHRANMLINLYPREGRFAARGSYQVIPEAGGKLKYLYIAGKKYYDYSKARRAFNDTFTAFFPFDEEEYERRKQEAISNYFSEGKYTKSRLIIEARDKYIRYLIKTCPSLTRDDVARIGGISVRTVYRALEALDN